MKSLLMTCAVLVLAAVAYIGSPFVTAWSIREAVRNGDSAYLTRAIDWPSIRQTLKPSLHRIAFDLPDPESLSQRQPGLWQRFKAYWGQGAVNSAVDNYLTPENLPQLYAMRKSYRSYTTGDDDDATKLPLLERVSRFWARVKRAEFTSLTTVEIDLVDKHNANRMYLGRLDFTGTGWILRSLRIRDSETADTKPTPPQTDLATSAKKSAWRGAAAKPAPQPLLSIGWSLNFISPADAAPASGRAQQPHEESFWQRAKAAAR